MNRRNPIAILAVVLAIPVAFLFLYPVGVTFTSLFIVDGQLDLSAFGKTLAIDGVGQTFLNTMIVVIASGAIAVLLGSLFAWLNERTDARMGAFSGILPIVPLLIPSIAVVIGWVFLASPRAGLLNVAFRGAFPWLELEQGPLNIFSWGGLIFVYSLELLPFVYLTVSAALRSLDPALEEASRMSGAGPLTTLRKVTLPAVSPAVGAGALLALVMGMALYSIPAVIGGASGIKVLSAQIVELLRGTYPPRTAEAVVLGFLILIVVMSGWALQRRILRAGRSSTVGGRGQAASKVPLGPLKWPARLVMWLYLFAAVVLPGVGLIYVSLQKFWSGKFEFVNLGFDAYRRVLFQEQATSSAILNSFTSAAIGATIGMTITFIFALAVWQRRSRVLGLIDGLVKLPAGFSHLVIATGLLVVFTAPPVVLTGTIVLVLIAYIILYLPQGSLNAGAAVAQVDKSLAEASSMSGASDFRTTRKILLPLMLPGLVVGWAFLFIFMNIDVTASVLLGSTRTPVNGFMLVTLYENSTFPVVAALAMIVTVVSTTVVVSALAFSRKFGGVPPSV